MPAPDFADLARALRTEIASPPRDTLARLIDAARAGSLTPEPAAPAPVRTTPQRDRLWELSGNLHCSIIGTCLTTADLRALLAKLGEPAARTMSEHALHGRAVVLAGRKDGGGKLLHKLLDRCHARAVARADRLGDVRALRAYWREAVDRGEVAGAYWAVLTHPLTDHALVQAVFGEVHMLSHLVGRAVRADLRRLAALEAALDARNETVAELEARVRTLTAEKVELAGHLVAARRDAADRDAEAAIPARADAVPDAAQWRERLDRAETHAVAEGRRRAALEGEVAGLADALRQAGEREDALRAERNVLEALLARRLDGDADGSRTMIRLDGATVLYVGGRPGPVAQARRLVSERGGMLLTHDGGVEEATGLLPGLVGQADLVLFPVDCVSHDAMQIVKRACRDGGPRLVALRSASLAALAAALENTGERARAPRTAGNVRSITGGSP